MHRASSSFSSSGAARAHSISYSSCAPSFAQGATTGPQGTKRTRRHPAHSTPLPPDARRASPSPPEPTPHIAPVARRAPKTRTARLGLASSRRLSPLLRRRPRILDAGGSGTARDLREGGFPALRGFGTLLRGGLSGLGGGEVRGIWRWRSRKCGGFDSVVGRLATRASARAPRVSWLVVWAPDSGSAG